MIGKAKSNKSLQATIAYNEREKATLIYSNKLEGTSLNDYRIQMEDLQKCYTGYGRQLTIHAILSPAIEDGKSLSMEKWQVIADNYLSKMNMQDLQAIGFLHADKEHRHMHLVINKVKESDFKLVHDGYIGKKSQKMADDIAKEMKLVRAMEIKQERIANELRAEEALKIGIHVQETSPIGAKQQFKTVLDKLAKNNYPSVNEYFKALENAGFKIHSYINKETGELRGYGLEKDGTKMDASAIGKKFTLKALNLSENNTNVEKLVIVPEKTSINQVIVTTLTDISKIAMLENYALSMGISKETLKNNEDMELIEQGQRFFLAMKNDSGGYTMNNVFSKKYFGENDITVKIIHEKLPVLVVEDPFAYLLHKQQNPNNPNNYIILNSIGNKDKVISKLSVLNASIVILQLKNDAIGKSISEKIVSTLKNTVAGNKLNIEVKGDKNQIATEKKIANGQNVVKPGIKLEMDPLRDKRLNKGLRL